MNYRHCMAALLGNRNGIGTAERLNGLWI